MAGRGEEEDNLTVFEIAFRPAKRCTRSAHCPPLGRRYVRRRSAVDYEGRFFSLQGSRGAEDED